MFSAADVKNLRDQTGAGMMDCKKALQETNGNMEEAITWLREKGISKAAKKAERIAAEGLASVTIDGNKAIVLEVNSETDFVAKNDEFKNFVSSLENSLLNSDVNTVEEANNLVIDGMKVVDMVAAITAKIGEKISFRRFEKLEKTDDEIFGAYTHMGGKIVVATLIKGSNEELAKDIAMHTCAMRPIFIDVASVPVEVIEKEKAIAREQAINEGKPEAIAEKMVEGRIKKYFKEVCLLEQPFIKDDSLTVGKYIENNNCKLINMIRYEVGEGIEKREDNFAEEVMNQING